MARLREHLTDPEERADVVQDACALIDRRVAAMSGVSGLAVRSAYRVLSGVRPGMVSTAVDGLLEPFADQLDPYYQEHLATGQPLEQILSSRRSEVADALLAITDERAGRTSNRTVRTAYQRVRGTARRHVEDAVPGVAGMIAAHAPAAQG